MSLAGANHPVEAGSAVFVPGEVEHGITNTGSGLLRFFYIFDVDAFTDVRYGFPGVDY